MTPPRLELRSISHNFFNVPVNKDISLSVAPGEVLGLVGENGAGKSTLMNVVGGVMQPTEGELFVDGEPYAPSSPAEAARRGIAHVHQELNLFANLSIADNIFLTNYPRRAGIFTDRRAARERSRRALDLMALPFSPDTRVERLSPGQRQMLEIAKAAVGEPGLIILDEPTTSLTSRETERLFQLIADLTASGTSVVYVSHILEDVKALSDRVAVMRDGNLVDVRAASDAPIGEIITLMVGRRFDQRFPDRDGAPTSEPVLTLDGVCATGLVDDVSLTVHRGEVVGLFGLMGAGRTELARIIAGLETADAGTITLNGADVGSTSPRQRIAAGLALVTEDRRGDGLLMDFPVITNAALPSLGRWSRHPVAPVQRRRLRRDVAAIAEELRIKTSSLREAPVRSLSGGNQQKVVLAKWLLTEPSLLILDEPTRGVDVGAQFEVYRTALALADRGAGILAISSELPELLGMCDRIGVMRQGRLVAEFAKADFDSRAILGAAFGEALVPGKVG
ncbi:sugar ABC transporter ATP-binding protein [Georgenia yuyongxinii]|uniref:Sugar ABC transporter ATP-binding protein n=1 Tax=Georgenia yuyongxinii TaxID=2589797 RepID=A0A5B8C7C5_9MICO|nr:sugar ABC transporter ATP-binding protein [Georgenia yuyongxinii]QDC23826.1 sugar ABC transporter ATP-binding protein [Georgenia yuyongxinii]